MTCPTSTIRAIIAASQILAGTALIGCQPAARSDAVESVPSEDGDAASADRIELSPGAVASLELTHARAEVRELSPSLEFPAGTTATCTQCCRGWAWSRRPSMMRFKRCF